MDSFILIQGELRSLIRNSLEKIIGKRFKKKQNKNIDILLKISIRVVSSLIAIQIFNKVKDIPNIRKYTSFILIGLFIFFFIQEKSNSQMLDK